MNEEGAARGASVLVWPVVRTYYLPCIFERWEEGLLTHYVQTDLGGLTRGRAAWNGKSDALDGSVGWVPVNQLASPFDTIPSPNPWGPSGDCRLRPDGATLVDVQLDDDVRLRTVLCDMVELDGRPNPLCSRDFLRRVVQKLADEGLSVMAAFEQEFWLELPGTREALPGFSLQRSVQAEPFVTDAARLLDAAGLEPEMLLAEFAPDQFELTVRPTSAIAAADRAVLTRELLRMVARKAGGRASFTPVRAPGSLGSGTHIHFSLWDESGAPITYAPGQNADLSPIAQAFCAGITRHMRALCALTASSVVSYERLQPHRWSAAYTCLGRQNREATLRVCPIVGFSTTPVERQFNIEYRAADATANPYVALAGLLAAGLDGILSGAALSPLVDSDPSELTDAEQRAAGVERLPTSLPEALDVLERDDVLTAAMGPELYQAFLLAKRHEVAHCAGLDPAALHHLYASIY
jgi:glutamine synthetase